MLFTFTDEAAVLFQTTQWTVTERTGTKKSLAEHFQTKVTFRLISSEMLPFILYLTA